MAEDIHHTIHQIEDLERQLESPENNSRYIIEAPLRNPFHHSNNPNAEWGERHINIDVNGPPLLFPEGEEWVDPDTGEEMSGLRKLPDEGDLNSYHLRQDIDRQGIDALAWYRSFHFAPTARWGIYLLDSGIYYLAKVFEDQYAPSDITPETRQACINDAIQLLYYHELFHFYSDLAATRIEIEQKKPIYLDYVKNRFKDGWDESDGAPFDIPAKLEEALANEFARHKTIGTSYTPQYKQILTEFMGRQPSGYKQWAAVRKNAKWKPGLHELGVRLHNPSNPFPSYLYVKSLEEAIEKRYEKQVPVYIVDTVPDDIYRFTSFHMDIHDYTWSSAFKTDYKKAPDITKLDFQKSEKYIRANGKVNPGRNPGPYKSAKRGRFWKYKVKGKPNQWRVIIDKVKQEWTIMAPRKKVYKEMKRRT